MPLRDIGGSCSGGGGGGASAAAAPLSSLATRLTERATGAAAGAPRRRDETDETGALVHRRFGAPSSRDVPSPVHVDALGRFLPPTPPPPLAPPTRFVARLPEPDARAATAMFEAAFVNAGIPSPIDHRPSPALAPRPTPAVGAVPWIPAPHMWAHYRMPPPAPFVARQMYVPPQMYMPPAAAHMGRAVVEEGRQGVEENRRTGEEAAADGREVEQGVENGDEEGGGDALFEELMGLLGSRTRGDGGVEDTLRVDERRLMDALTGASQRSWSDEFTSLDDNTFAQTESGESDGSDADAIAEELARLDAAYDTGRSTATRHTFGERNRYGALTAAEALAEGERLREAGEIAEAQQALEAAVAPRGGERLTAAQEVRGWYLLGLTHAELDDDGRAIQALAQVGRLAGEGEMEIAGMAALAQAVSHVNELDATHATEQLRRWVSLRARIRGETLQEWEAGGEDALGMTASLLERVAGSAPRDADAQLALGVAQHAARAHDAAAAALQRAVALRANDARLWNMLGATLANGRRTDDALRAYRRAVDLSPRHVRAWVNVGTAYANLGLYDRAVRYYLRALHMATTRQRGSGDDMQHVWQYLRGALFSLDRLDLLELVEANDLDALRPHFAF